MNIDLLANRPQFIETLAPQLLEYWRPYLPEDTLTMRTQKLRSHLNLDRLPIAVVAYENDEVMGTAALRECDLPGYEQLSPWLGGLYVADAFRRQGIGHALCRAVEKLALELLDARTLFLFTIDKQPWYERQGWRTWSPCIWMGHTGTIMQKTSSAND